ncbi:Gfo/Idh/MocA family protein [Halorussus sp. AFM4]|uniref:Gfo/Idh/MocA family protein n=1 Tax=Halorussus sp. AFM4 TaxID=3421651 RepID=UPI003EB7CAF3
MTVEVAVIGAGGMAADHLANLSENPDAETVGVCATSEASARSTADEFEANGQIGAYADPATCYDAEEPDAAIVAVPPYAHPGPELAAAERGIDLLVEKPLALARDDARRVRDVVAEADLVTQVGHMYRYADIVERAVDLLGDRQVALVEGRWIDGVAPLDWWPERAESGGQVVEQAVHVYDLVRYLAGGVDSVEAHGGEEVVTDAIDFPDTSSATMRHESGAVSHVAASSASPTRDVGLELVAENCRLELDFDAHRLAGVADGEEVREEGSGAMYAAELDAFVAAVEAGEPGATRSPYADALRSFELTMDVTERIEAG